MALSVAYFTDKTRPFQITRIEIHSAFSEWNRKRKVNWGYCNRFFSKEKLINEVFKIGEPHYTSEWPYEYETLLAIKEALVFLMRKGYSRVLIEIHVDCGSCADYLNSGESDGFSSEGIQSIASEILSLLQGVEFSCNFESAEYPTRTKLRVKIRDSLE